MFAKILDKIFTKKNNNDLVDCQHNLELITKKYLSIYHTLPKGIVTLNKKQFIINDYNNSFSDLFTNFQYPIGVGVNFKDLICDDDRTIFNDWIKKIIDTNSEKRLKIRLFQNNLHTKNKPFWVKIKCVYLSDNDEMILSIDNIDSYVLIEQKLKDEQYISEQTNIAKNEFLISMSFEIKNSLSGILDQIPVKSTATNDLKELIKMTDDILSYYKVNPEQLGKGNYKHYKMKNNRIENKIKSVKILVVDDNKTNQILAQKMIESFTHATNVETAYNGQEALDKILENDFDLVFMDLNMPVMDGYEATAFIRDKNSKYYRPNLPIVMLTAADLDSDRDKAIDMGVNDYLIKPVDGTELIYMVDKWV